MSDTQLSQSTTHGLMAFWSDIAMANQPAYQRWHNNEHIPERLSIPGFVRGRRFRSVTNELRFLMYYDTTSLEVLTSPAYLARLNAPTPRTCNALKWFQNGNRTAYHLVASHGSCERAAPPIVAVVSFAPALDTGRETDEVRRVRQASLQRIVATLGLERALEYRLDDAGSTVSTGEASVHNAAPSVVTGLLILHSTDLALLDDEAAWQILDEALVQWAALNGVEQPIRKDVYSLEFALQNEKGES